MQSELIFPTAAPHLSRWLKRWPPGLGAFWPCDCCGTNDCPCTDSSLDYMQVTLSGFGNNGCTNCEQINVVITLKRFGTCNWLQCSPAQDFGCFNSITQEQDPLLVAACYLEWIDGGVTFFLDGFNAVYELQYWNCESGELSLITDQPYEGPCTLPETLALSAGDEYGCDGGPMSSGCCPGTVLPDSLTLTVTDDGGCSFLTGKSITLTGSGAERVWSGSLGSCGILELLNDNVTLVQVGQSVDLEVILYCFNSNTGVEGFWILSLPGLPLYFQGAPGNGNAVLGIQITMASALIEDDECSYVGFSSTEIVNPLLNGPIDMALPCFGCSVPGSLISVMVSQ